MGGDARERIHVVNASTLRGALMMKGQNLASMDKVCGVGIENRQYSRPLKPDCSFGPVLVSPAR